MADWLASTSGISTTIIGSHSLRRAIQLRLQATQLQDGSAYLERLLSSPEEQQELVELVVVPETWFFRDRHPFVHLREHVQALLQSGSPSQPLRLLSAPCASGEEPYSMAMTLLEMGLPKEAFSIDAIDICRQSIRKARQAVYTRHSFRGVSVEEQQKYFQSRPEGLALHPEIRQAVQFRRANLMHCLAEIACRYDVIFCRNLLIYLDDAASQQLLEASAELLRPGGLLIVGSAETGKVPTNLFSPIRAPFVFGFLRREDEASQPLPALSPDASSVVVSTGGRERAAPVRPPRRAPLRSTLPAAEPRPAAVPSVAEQELQRYREQLERDPCSDAAYLRMAEWMVRHNRLEEAMECLQKCLYLKPDSREALKAMIQLSKQLGQVARSRQFQGRLARLEP